MIDRLSVQHYRWLLAVIYKPSEFEQSLLEDNRQIRLKAVHLFVDLSAEDGVKAVGFVTLEIYDFQVFLLADRDKPIPAGLFVEDLLEIDDLLSVVADPRVDVLHVID